MKCAEGTGPICSCLFLEASAKSAPTLPAPSSDVDQMQFLAEFAFLMD